MSGTTMYGKHFASLYDGSMFGRPAIVFAIWGYVIAKQRPDRRDNQCYIELNPVLLAATFASKVDDVIAAIEELMSPDPSSRSEEEDGRRLVRIGGDPAAAIIGPTQFRVVNGPKYRAIRDEEERRIYLRDAKRKERASTASTLVNRRQPPSTQVEVDSEEEEYLSFGEAWEAYPRKRGKSEALRHFKAQVQSRADHAALLSAIRNYRHELAILETEEKHMQYGSTFFNGNWRDYVDGVWKPPTGKPTPRTPTFQAAPKIDE